MGCRDVRHVLWLPLVGALLMAAGCMGSSGTGSPMYYYTLDYPSPVLTVDQPLPFVVRVERFTAAPPFNTQRIIYADKGLHRNAYATSQWIAPPGDMLAYLLARDLQRSKAFQAVLSPDAMLSPTHLVKGWVETFIEEGTTHPGKAMIQLHLTLLDSRRPEPATRILYQGSYKAEAQLAERTPAALAQAMSMAAADMAGTILRDIQTELTLTRTAE